jgi:4-azaleucine resistance transporter AzlC
MIYSLTDETYSVFCGLPGEENDGVMLRVALYDHLYWVTGSVVGGLLAQQLPFDLTGIDYSMTALFIVIMVEQWLNSKEHLPVILGVCTTIVCLVIFGADLFIIPAMVFIALELVIFRKKLDKTGEPEIKEAESGD